MKRLNYFLLILLLPIMVGCEEPLPIQEFQPVSQEEASDSGVAQADTTSAWPPADPNNNEKVELANDLLAKNYYYILDGSGSMKDSDCSDGETKRIAAINALGKLIKVIPENVNVGLLVFDGKGITERVSLSPNSKLQQSNFIRALNEANNISNTPLHNAIVKGLWALEHQARKQLGYGEYNLVVVTDGEFNEGPDPIGVVNHIVDKTPVRVNVIGFCIDENHSLNQPGRTTYKTASNPEELFTGLKAVLAESETFDVSEFK
jgi:hypothetical protein